MSRPGPLPPGSVIGIVGGGQLGRMSAMAAAKLGYRCVVLAPDPACPAGQVAEQLVGRFDDEAALARFARAVDVATFEFENVSAAGLQVLEGLVELRPGAAILALSQDRAREKGFVNSLGIRTAPWRTVEDEAALAAALDALGLPVILKTRRLGYDGKGQRRCTTRIEAHHGLADLAPAPLIAEAVVDFALEISVIVARGQDGTMRAFDPTENRHAQGILDVSLAPARLTEAIEARAREVACTIAAALDLVGVLAVEMFVDADGDIVVNELAPRPHNSGHWTIEACQASQFEMHVRAVAGLDLPPAQRHADAVMKNLIGPRAVALFGRALAEPGASPHHYGKREAREGRKMGHVTWLFPRGSLPGPLGVAGLLEPFA